MKKWLNKLVSFFSKKKETTMQDYAEWFTELDEETKARFLHLSGLKPASGELQKKWLDDRRKKTEMTVDSLIDNLVAKNSNNQMEKKAGIMPIDTTNTIVDILRKNNKSDNPLLSAPQIEYPILTLEQKLEKNRKQAEKELEAKRQMDFEALPFSRITRETRDKIKELVREDIKAQADKMAANFPEIELDNHDKFIMGLFDENNDVIIKKRRKKK